jgi:putative peptidoglycan lipid II flippase
MKSRSKDAKEHTVTRAAVGMGGVTAVSRLAGFVRVLVIAAVLGTTYLGNTFQAANSVSNVLFRRS